MNPSLSSRVRSLIRVVVVGLGLIWAAPVQAAPRDDIKMAYIDAADQLNNLEIPEALATLDAAVARAQSSGLAEDPSLAPLHAMRGGLIFANTANAQQTVAALEQAVRLDYYVQLPIELRSEELQALLDEARASVGSPPSTPMVHKPPVATTKEDVEFAAIVNAVLPDEATMVLYWRTAGSNSEFKALYMDLFRPGNSGTATVSVQEHGGKNIEYFIYAFDGNQKAIANIGDKEHAPVLELDTAADAAAAAAGQADGEPGTKPVDEGKAVKKPKPRGKTSLPRFFINLGVGTGAGIANGQADLTYEQYTPGTQNSVYGAAEQACAIERWFEAGEPLADDPATFQENLADIQSVGADTLPGNPVDLAAAYNADYCKRRHPVSPGMALAPFHVAPEFGVRVAKRVVLSVYARLQVVSGSKVYSDNPDLELGESFNRDVRSPAPPGTRNRPPFSWAIGAKAKYFFLPDDRKFRLFAGGFAGYGTARLRVPMGFSNDRNGNSVPDAVEVALHGTQDMNNEIIPETCVPVWPYNAGCVPPEDGTEGDADRTLARQVLMSTPSSDQRIDTVRIGPGFVGVLFGFHYQIVNHFALFAELDVGGWFPNTSSVLFDLTLGPAITF